MKTSPEEAVYKKDKDALNHLLSTPEGRWFLIRLLEDCMIYADTFTGDNRTFFNEGKRSVGLRIMARVNELGEQARLFKHQGENEYYSFLALEISKKQEERNFV